MQGPYDNQHSQFDEWEEPGSLEGKFIPSWPKRVFPEPIEEFVHELARFTETPVELSALLALSTIATAAHKKYQVQVKEGYCEPTNIWTIGILPPASRKSSVYKEITAPLKEWERQQKLLIDPIIKSATSNLKTQEARLKGLRSKAAQATNNAEYAKLQNQIEEIESMLPKVPTCPQIWASDITNEQLGVVMSNNDDTLSLLSDEGGLFDIISGLYSDGRSNIDLLLQAHSACPVRVDRGSRPPIFMDRAVLTMGLTVQPQVIKKIRSNKTFRGRGLLGRFLYVMPKSNIGFRTLDQPPISRGLISSFRKVINNILSHPHQKENDKATLYTLEFTQEAFEKWLTYAQLNERLMCESDLGFLSHITDWAGKLPGAIARIAALLHIARYADVTPWKNKISLEDVTSAIEIGHVLSRHALAVFDFLHEIGSVELGRSILTWIKENHFLKFTLRDCKRKFRADPEMIENTLPFLEDKQIIREYEAAPSAGRKSTIYFVNPKFLSNI